MEYFVQLTTYILNLSQKSNIQGPSLTCTGHFSLLCLGQLFYRVGVFQTSTSRSLFVFFSFQAMSKRIIKLCIQNSSFPTKLIINLYFKPFLLSKSKQSKEVNISDLFFLNSQKNDQFALYFFKRYDQSSKSYLISIPNKRSL